MKSLSLLSVSQYFETTKHSILCTFKVTDLKHIKVRPILLRKGNVKIAIYGMSHVKDERLHRLFREEKVWFIITNDKYADNDDN